MQNSKVALALLGAVGASAAFAISWLRGDGDLASEGSPIGTVSLERIRDSDSIAATESISVSLRDQFHHCHWHQGNRLNSPFWWLAEYYRAGPERYPTNAQIDELAALLAKIEVGWNAASVAVDAELASAVKDRISQVDFRSNHPMADQDRGSNSSPFPRKRMGWGHVSLPYGYGASFVISGLPGDEFDIFVEILEGERLALDAALDAKATLHHDAPKRIRQLIESFK